MTHLVQFVSGIDTDAGKTVATGWLARRRMDAGLRVATVKPVQTGVDGFSPDLAVHRRLMGIDRLPEDLTGDTNPQSFRYPASPHLAAALEGRTVDVDACVHAVERVCAAYDLTLVEGAGGLMVPLTTDLLTIDWAASQGWPVVFVASGKLGAINHALLSFEAMASRGMTLALLIWNEGAARLDPVIERDAFEVVTRAALRMWPDVEVLRLPKLSI